MYFIKHKKTTSDLRISTAPEKWIRFSMDHCLWSAAFIGGVTKVTASSKWLAFLGLWQIIPLVFIFKVCSL